MGGGNEPGETEGLRVLKRAFGTQFGELDVRECKRDEISVLYCLADLPVQSLELTEPVKGQFVLVTETLRRLQGLHRREPAIEGRARSRFFQRPEQCAARGEHAGHDFTKTCEVLEQEPCGILDLI